jgi:phosphoserine phosphatase
MTEKKKFILVTDADGVLLQTDIASDFFEKYGLKKEFDRASSSIAQQVRHGGQWEGRKAYGAQTLEYMLRRYTLEIESKLKEGKSKPITALREIGEGSKEFPGAKKFLEAVRKNPKIGKLYVLSASYKPALDAFMDKMGVKTDGVIATEVREVGEGGLLTVGPARGGVYKADELRRISRRTGVPLNKFIYVGDSITDREALQAVGKAGGLAIGFNPTKDTMKVADFIVGVPQLSDLDLIVKEFVEKGSVKKMRLDEFYRKYSRAGSFKGAKGRKARVFKEDVTLLYTKKQGKERVKPWPWIGERIEETRKKIRGEKARLA